MQIQSPYLRKAQQRRLRHKEAGLSQTDCQHSRLDQFLARSAHAAQLGLLALGVFGYFYTVLPVYQKAILDEEIAKKTIELSQKAAELESKTREVEALEAASRIAEKKLAVSSQRINELKRNVDDQYAELRIRLGNDFQILGHKICGIDSREAASKFASCLLEKVLPLAVFDPWSSRDKAVIAEAIGRIKSKARDSGLEIDHSFALQKDDLDKKIKQARYNCEKGKKSDNYNNFNTKLEMDLICSNAERDYQFGNIKLQIKRSSEFGRITSSLLEIISQSLAD